MSLCLALTAFTFQPSVGKQRSPYLVLASAIVSAIFFYGTVIAGGLAISKNLSLESADIQAFVMERLPIV